jgi:hypothetical protein
MEKRLERRSARVTLKSIRRSSLAMESLAKRSNGGAFGSWGGACWVGSFGSWGGASWVGCASGESL